MIDQEQLYAIYTAFNKNRGILNLGLNDFDFQLDGDQYKNIITALNFKYNEDSSWDWKKYCRDYIDNLLYINRSYIQSDISSTTEKGKPAIENDPMYRLSRTLFSKTEKRRNAIKNHLSKGGYENKTDLESNVIKTIGSIKGNLNVLCAYKSALQIAIVSIILKNKGSDLTTTDIIKKISNVKLTDESFSKKVGEWEYVEPDKTDASKVILRRSTDLKTISIDKTDMPDYISIEHLPNNTKIKNSFFKKEQNLDLSFVIKDSKLVEDHTQSVSDDEPRITIGTIYSFVKEGPFYEKQRNKILTFLQFIEKELIPNLSYPFEDMQTVMKEVSDQISAYEGLREKYNIKDFNSDIPFMDWYLTTYIKIHNTDEKTNKTLNKNEEELKQKAEEHFKGYNNTLQIDAKQTKYKITLNMSMRIGRDILQDYSTVVGAYFTKGKQIAFLPFVEDLYKLLSEFDKLNVTLDEGNSTVTITGEIDISKFSKDDLNIKLNIISDAFYSLELLSTKTDIYNQLNDEKSVFKTYISILAQRIKNKKLLGIPTVAPTPTPAETTVPATKTTATPTQTTSTSTNVDPTQTTNTSDTTSSKKDVLVDTSDFE